MHSLSLSKSLKNTFPPEQHRRLKQERREGKGEKRHPAVHNSPATSRPPEKGTPPRSGVLRYWARAKPPPEPPGGALKRRVSAVETLVMSLGHPLVAAGSHDVRPRKIPAPIRRMILLMVRGHEDNPDKALDFIEDARLADVAPDRARRWLDTSECRGLLRAERRRYRDEICAFNESSLRTIRDHSRNDMARLGAVHALENIAEEAEARPRGQHQEAPGLLIVINNGPQQSAPVIDVTPTSTPVPNDTA
jgi:hypothetical protein